MKNFAFLFPALLICLLIPSLSNANMARPIQPSDFQASAIGTPPMFHIKVLHEDLKIDFRESNEGTACITAIYKIECTHLIDTLPLIFVAGNLYQQYYTAEFDGTPIISDTVMLDSVPPSWQLPDSVLWKKNYIPYYYHNNMERSYYHSDKGGFIRLLIVNLTEGQHTIKVTYKANLSAWFTASGGLTKHQSLAYVLKPEPSGWQSFNNLHLTIIIPDDCDYTINLPIEKEEVKDGARYLSAHWNELPASYVTAVILKDDSKARRLSTLFIVLSSLITLGLTLLWAWLVARYSLSKRFPSFMRIVNYIVPFLVLLIEIVSVLNIVEDDPVYWLAVAASLIIAIWIVMRYFPTKKKSKQILYYANCLAYVLAIGIAVYSLFYFNEGALICIAFIILVLVSLRTISTRLAKSRKHGAILRFINSMLIALFVTIAFFFIYFQYGSILQSQLEEHINPRVLGNGYVILLAPFIYIIALLAICVINSIFIKLLRRKQVLNY